MDSRVSLLGWLLAVPGTIFVGTSAKAAESCADQMKVVKAEINAMRGGSNLTAATQYYAAAQKALDAHNEAECLIEVKKAEREVDRGDRRSH